MPARIRTVVDPRFPAELARLRRERGLSLRELARLAFCSKSCLHDLEAGRTRPTSDVARQLDVVLQAGGALAAMVVDVAPATTPDDDQRIAYAVAHPTRLDEQAVRALADTLAAQRRLDDLVAASAMLPWAVPQWNCVQDLAAQAGGPHAAELHAVVAEWTQFVGWLYAEAGAHVDAVRVLVKAGEQADAVADGPMSAQVENFRGYVERQRKNPLGIVRHFLGAYHTPGSSTLQRVGDAAQAAHGYALLGDRVTASRLLGEASDLITAAESASAPAHAYWLTPTFCRMNLGLAYLGLGDKVEAADNLRAGLTSLPADQQDAEWTQEYRRALATAG